jgi:hypothetical protein
MSSDHDEIIRKLHFLQEFQLAVSTIESGFAIIQRGPTGAGHRFLVLLVLSTGLERFMKLLLCLHTFDADGRFLSENELRQLGHDLVRLRDEVVQRCFSHEALSRPAVGEDYQFIQGDEFLDAILQLFSDFAKGDRYIYLRGLNEPQDSGAWLDARWERIEQMTASSAEIVGHMRENTLDTYYDRAELLIIVCLERFLRALARTVTLGSLGAEARSLGNGVWGFLMKRDEDLGRKQYELLQ